MDCSLLIRQVSAGRIRRGAYGIGAGDSASSATTGLAHGESEGASIGRSSRVGIQGGAVVADGVEWWWS